MLRTHTRVLRAIRYPIRALLPHLRCDNPPFCVFGECLNGDSSHIGEINTNPGPQLHGACQRAFHPPELANPSMQDCSCAAPGLPLWGAPHMRFTYRADSVVPPSPGCQLAAGREGALCRPAAQAATEEFRARGAHNACGTCVRHGWDITACARVTLRHAALQAGRQTGSVLMSETQVQTLPR
jgi:hypothetical protein